MKTILLAIFAFGLVGSNGLARSSQFPAAAQQPVQHPTPVLQPNQNQYQVASPVQYQLVQKQIQNQVPTQIPNQVQNRVQNPGQTTIPVPIQVHNPVVISNAHLRDIDRLMAQLSGATKVLHEEFHGHLVGVRHAAKLDQEVTALERQAESLQTLTATADGSAQSVATLRSGTNEFIQLAVRISRTIDLTEPWLPGNDSRVGIQHMRDAARNLTVTGLQIDAYLPVDTHVIDVQVERLEAAVKELHDEYHEHLEGYEVSQHLDADLEELETLVEHMHELAHNKSWAQTDLNYLAQDVDSVRHKTAHIETLFVRQSKIGVRKRDWIGIEHSRDAITDVLSSAFLLDHMIRKTTSSAQSIQLPVRQDHTRPLRDRHGHEIQPQGVQPLHQQPFQQQPLQGQPQEVVPGT